MTHHGQAPGHPRHLCVRPEHDSRIEITLGLTVCGTVADHAELLPGVHSLSRQGKCFQEGQVPPGRACAASVFTRFAVVWFTAIHLVRASSLPKPTNPKCIRTTEDCFLAEQPTASPNPPTNTPHDMLSPTRYSLPDTPTGRRFIPLTLSPRPPLTTCDAWNVGHSTCGRTLGAPIIISGSEAAASPRPAPACCCCHLRPRPPRAAVWGPPVHLCLCLGLGSGLHGAT